VNDINNNIKNLVNDVVTVDFYPFNTAQIDLVEAYIRNVVGSLSDIRSLKVEADFKNFGSGFASFVPVKISKNDGSDVTTTQQNNQVTQHTNGILIYLCKLSPHWYAGASDWTLTLENGQFHSASNQFLSPQDWDNIDWSIWQHEFNQIVDKMKLFQYQLLEQSELIKPVEIKISSNLLDGKPKAFDCFFHWED
jgi:hypothetical protein